MNNAFSEKSAGATRIINKRTGAGVSGRVVESRLFNNRARMRDGVLRLSLT